MIRSLRGRLILVMMTLLTLVMVGVAFLFLSFTYSGVEEDSLIALEEAGKKYGLHAVHPDGKTPEKGPKDKDGPREDKPPEDGKPNDKKENRAPQTVIPCYVVGYDHDGILYADGPRYYDVSDEERMEQILIEARATGKDHGVLTDRQLRFLRLDDVCGEAYAFTDITSESGAMSRVVRETVIICVVALVGLFTISLLVSRWATRPTEQVMGQQRQFVADASHELKTPLTVILTNAELMEDPGCTEEEKRKATGYILTMARQMRVLVDELLDLARVNGGIQSELKEPTDFSRQAEGVSLLFEPIYFESGRELHSQIDRDIFVMGIPGRLGQVVEILLDNGCKYSREGSAVYLKLQRSGRKKCILTVESQGDMLTQQECRDIFKRFYRLERHRGMNHSCGLGLAIAQNIVCHHKGEIWVESRDGVNTFCVSLPTVTGNG